MKKHRPYIVVLLWTILVASLLGFAVYIKFMETEKTEYILGFLKTHSNYVIYVAVLLLIIGIWAILSLWRQERELKKLAKATSDLASGTMELSNLSFRGMNASRIWNSLLEVQKNVNRINYSKQQIWEACYRFIPKNIEKILGKHSIQEVHSGDMVQVWGTVAIVSSVEPRDMQEKIGDDKNRFVMLLEKHQEKEHGFFATGNCSLSELKILFLENLANTIKFGVSFMNELHEIEDLKWMRTCIVLHYSQYVYGIAGTNQQSFPFLVSEEMKELEKYAEWFRNMNLSLIITETAKQQKQTEHALRYIGYIRISRDGKLNLYEVLDACKTKERKMKIQTDVYFQKALELFYQHDFYLARSTFSEVLKENPKDALAKWYLFTCEKYLNEVCIEGDICRLYWDI